MKTYDKLSKSKKDKFNSLLLYSLHYTIVVSVLLIIYTMCMLSGAFLIISALIFPFVFFFYGLLLIALGLFMFLIMKRTKQRFEKERKKIYEIDKEEDLFK